MVSRRDYGRDFSGPKQPAWKRALRAFGLAFGCLLLLAWTTADKESFEKVGVPIVGIGALLIACRQDTRTRTKILLSCIGLVALAGFAGNWTVAAIVVANHVLILFLHNIEVKVNRLLDEKGISVTDEELAE
jgi:uncharacterized membrane protein